MNEASTQNYDNLGMAEGNLLTLNDIGTQKYEFEGMAEGFLGTVTVPPAGPSGAPGWMMMGFGM